MISGPISTEPSHRRRDRVVTGLLGGSRSRRAQPNGIVEADRLAVQSYAAGENSYRSSVEKVLDGPAA